MPLAVGRNCNSTKYGSYTAVSPLPAPLPHITLVHHANGCHSPQSDSFVGPTIEMFHYIGDVFFFLVCVHFYSPQLTIFIYLSGKNCSTSVSACASDVEYCKNGGTCFYNSAGEIQCICPPGIGALYTVDW